MRMTPTPGDVASSGDVTRVSDSVIHQSQSHLAAVGDRAYGAIAEAIAVDEEQSRQISSLLEKVSDCIGPICHFRLTNRNRSIIWKWNCRLSKVRRSNSVNWLKL